MLKALEDEKDAVNKDIGQVEHKLGVNDTPRPTTSRPGTRAKTSRGRGRKSVSGAGEDDENRPKTQGGKKNNNFRVVSEVCTVKCFNKLYHAV